MICMIFKTIQSVVAISSIIFFLSVNTGMVMTPEFARMEGMIIARLINPLNHLNVGNDPQSFDQTESDASTVSMGCCTEESIAENQKMDPIKNASSTVQGALHKQSFEDGFSMLSKPVSHRRHHGRK